jgi:DMSO reductase anchor subunit
LSFSSKEVLNWRKAMTMGAATWFLIGCSILFALTDESQSNKLSALIGFLIVWTVCYLDLLIMTYLLGSVFSWYEQVTEEGKIHQVFQIILFGTLKLGCLGLFIVILLPKKNIPQSALLLGMATLVLAPLSGGWIWSRKELARHA